MRENSFNPLGTGIKEKEKGKEFVAGKKEKKEEPEFKRLYRSGKEKILGGVCGGIAEYLKVDPVLIRLLWVASVFVWGSGILLYVIAWIIIPRNPEHKWKD
ncbi:MAG: PspC domain-containing protein [archaeon]